MRLLISMILILALAAGCDSAKDRDPVTSDATWEHMKKLKAERSKGLANQESLNKQLAHVIYFEEEEDLDEWLSQGASATFGLRRAVMLGKHEMCSHLIERGAFVGGDLLFMTTNQIATFRFLVENGADIHHRTPLSMGSTGWPSVVAGDSTLLHAAAEDGAADVMTLLLDLDLDPNDQNELGHTPLHVAAMAGQGSIVALLLKRGGDHSIRDFGGDLPRDVVCRSVSPFDSRPGHDDEPNSEERKAIELLGGDIALTRFAKNP